MTNAVSYASLNSSLSQRGETFVQALTLCGYASFTSGCGVFENFIASVIIPFQLAGEDRHSLVSDPLAVAGHHILSFHSLFAAAGSSVRLTLPSFGSSYSSLHLVFDRFALSSASGLRVGQILPTLHHTISIPLIIYTARLLELVFGKPMNSFR